MGFIATKNNLGVRLLVSPEEVFYLRFDEGIHLLKRGIFTFFSRSIKPVTFIANANNFDKPMLGKPVKLGS